MNVNLHIDNIVLSGIDLAPGECHLLRQEVVNQLTKMLTQQGAGAFAERYSDRLHVDGGSVHLGRSINAGSLAPQLASAIHGSLPPSAAFSHSRQKGRQ